VLLVGDGVDNKLLPGESKRGDGDGDDFVHDNRRNRESDALLDDDDDDVNVEDDADDKVDDDADDNVDADV